MKKIMINFLILVLLLSIFNGCAEKRVTGDDIIKKYNNEVGCNDLVKTVYTQEKFSELENRLQSYKEKSLNLSELLDDYNFECIRKISENDYYTVILREDNSKLFVFFNSDCEITNYIMFNNFKKTEDFNFIKKNVTHESEVIDFDKQYITYPVSAVNVTGHITKNGVIIIKYSRMADEVLQYDNIVDEVEFFEDDSIKDSDNFFIKNTPYILPIDKN